MSDNPPTHARCNAPTTACHDPTTRRPPLDQAFLIGVFLSSLFKASSHQPFFGTATVDDTRSRQKTELAIVIKVLSATAASPRAAASISALEILGPRLRDWLTQWSIGNSTRQMPPLRLAEGREFMGALDGKPKTDAEKRAQGGLQKEKDDPVGK